MPILALKLIHCRSVPTKPRDNIFANLCLLPVEWSLIAAKSGMDETQSIPSPIKNKPTTARPKNT